MACLTPYPSVTVGRGPKARAAPHLLLGSRRSEAARLSGLGPWERWTSGGPPKAPLALAFLLLPLLLATRHWPGGRHMLSELLNRKSAPRSSLVPFHVVSLIPRAGFQKRFTVSVLQSYAPFNVGVFQEVGGEQLQSKHVCLNQPAADRTARGGRRQCGLQARPHWHWAGADGWPVGPVLEPGSPLSLCPPSLPPSLSLTPRPSWGSP